jgi:uncharacterized protein YecE (DUF72 family)
MPRGAIRIGCSGWNYAHWRYGVFYPERLPASRWLEFYAERFGTVELNTTFYRLPTRRAVADWVARTPDDFVFAVKVSRYVTHVKRLRDVGEHLPILLDRLEPLLGTPKLGPLLWQLPPTFKRDDERLARALDEIPAGLETALEPRHESWFADDVVRLLAERDVALVVADRPEIRFFQRDESTAGFAYVRFHRGSRGRRGNYSDSELTEWSRRIRRWSARRDVYAYFNNDWEGFAPANALALRSLTARPSS